ncbi:hypothetical protein HYX08_06475 [Candidatus Woesearchaeota archaeon]|nr:hypothetical protein [Candidatus Woesearchaeota archaeon]
MARLIGMLLIATSILSLMAGAFVGWKYGSATDITGNAVSNLISQPEVQLSFFDYFEAVAFSCSIAGFLMGVVFLFRM